MKKLVIDIGGTFIKYALMDDDANIYEKGSTKTPQDSLAELIDAIYLIYKQYQNDVDGIALSLPGNIDSDTGLIYSPGALTYNANVNIIDEIHQRINLPVSVENDGKSAALAEVWKGKLKDCENGIVLILGTGIGGGIIHHKEIVKGKHFFAGEVSYMISNLCNPTFNFYEAFAMKGSTSALILRTAELKQMDPNEIDGIKVFEWIEQNDQDALQSLDEMTSVLANAIYNLQCLFDPDKILIGGGISKQPRLLTDIQNKLKRIYEQIPFPIPQANVDVCAHFNDSNLIGALYRYQTLYGGNKND
ncbi:MAG: ROK family protein [Traorella sp.]